MIEALVAIGCGLVLAVHLLPGGRLLSVILPFKTMIGIVALIIGIFHIRSFLGLALVAGGLVLTVKSLNKIPVIGTYLKQIGRFLARFQMIIGVFLIIVGVMEIVNF